MINFNTELTQGRAQWVLKEVFPIFAHRIAMQTLSRIAEGHNAVFKEQVGVPGCSCEYVATHRVWVSRLNQYKSQIEAIAYPPVEVLSSEIIEEAITEIQTLPNEIRVKTTRGRKKNNE
jgi:hypothetical protein